VDYDTLKYLVFVRAFDAQESLINVLLSPPKTVELLQYIDRELLLDDESKDNKHYWVVQYGELVAYSYSKTDKIGAIYTLDNFKKEDLVKEFQRVVDKYNLKEVYYDTRNCKRLL